MQLLKDTFSLFKIDIAKNASTLFWLLIWLIVFAYVSTFLQTAQIPVIIFLQEKIPDKESWPISIDLLRSSIWILCFLVGKELINLFKEFRKRGSLYRFTNESWHKDWIYNGKTKTLDENVPILRVTSSRAGCLLKRYLWKNFEKKFQMKFTGTDLSIGIIFRKLFYAGSNKKSNPNKGETSHQIFRNVGSSQPGYNRTPS